MSSDHEKYPKELKTVEALSPEMKAVEKLLKVMEKGEKPDIHDLIEASDLATQKWRGSETKARERCWIAFSAAYFIYLLGEAKEVYRERIMEDVMAHNIPMQDNSHFSLLVCKRYLGSDNGAASFQGQAMRGACLMGWDAETLRRNLKEGEWSMSKLVRRFRATSNGRPQPGDPNYIHGGGEDDLSETDAVSEAEVLPTLVWPNKYLDRWSRFATGEDIRITVRKTGAFRAEVVTASLRKPEA
jgi:hypothetical protein